MGRYFKVTTKINKSGTGYAYVQTKPVLRTKKPASLVNYGNDYDIYIDYFESKDEAWEFAQAVQ